MSADSGLPDVSVSGFNSWDSWRDRLTYLLAEYKLPIYAALLAVTILLAGGWWHIPSLPPFVATGLRGVALGILPATFLGKWLIVERFIPDPRKKVLNLEATDQGFRADPKKVPRPIWEQRQQNEDPVYNPPGETDHVVTSFQYHDDIDRLEVDGCNPELADPQSIVGTNDKLQAVFGDLTDKARELKSLKATMDLKQLEIEERNVNALAAAVEHGTAFEPGTGEEVVGLTDDGEEEPGRSDEQRETLSEMEQSRDHDQQPAQPAAATDGGETQ